ncbi:MAG: hypothetical protein B7Z73_11275, partial [Planctomycetia bacterium 21-64-5]
MSAKPARRGDSRSERRLPERAIVAALILVTLAVYSRACFNGFVNYDDTIYVTENRHVQEGLTRQSVLWALSSTQHANWHPLTWLSLQLDSALYGLKPAGFHATNVLLHVCNTVLLFWILRRTTGAVAASAVVAALFALHPLHVESVAWVAERKDVLSGLFWLLTLASYGRYAARPSLAWYAVTVALFALGLAAKAMVVTLPCALLLWDYWPLRRWMAPDRSEPPADQAGGAIGPKRVGWKWLLLEKVPMLVLAAGCSALAVLAQRLTGAIQSTESLSIGRRLAHVPAAYLDYVFKTFWPRQLAVYYPYPHLRSPPAYGIVAALALVGVTVWALRRRHEPYLAVGWLWFLGTLVPVIGLVQVGGQAIADRYTYLPSIGLFIAVVWRAERLARRDRFARRMALAAATVVLLSFAAATWIQIGYWHDGVALWRHALQVVGPDRHVWQGLGGALVEAGHDAEAIPCLEAAVHAGREDRSVHTNLGVALFRLGRYEQSQAEFEKAMTMNGGDSRAAYNLG